ncbi:MAG: efflux RND transporter periplasmic adaptor subunit [Pseudomonadota bacterium]
MIGSPLAATPKVFHKQRLAPTLSAIALALTTLWIASSAMAQPSTRLEEAPETVLKKGWIGVVLPLEAVDVAAQTAGRLERVSVRVGQQVDAGDPLAAVDPSTAQQAFLIAEAELRVAEAELARTSARSRQEAARLARRATTPNLWSEEELAAMDVEARAAEAEHAASAARVEKARATLEQLRQSLQELDIRAPFAGRVALRYLDPGAVVAPGAPIVRLVSQDALLVRFAVPPEELEHVHLGDTVRVTDVQARPIGTATVQRLSPEIDLAAQRLFAEAVLDARSLQTQPQGGLGVEVWPASNDAAATAGSAGP